MLGGQKFHRICGWGGGKTYHIIGIGAPFAEDLQRQAPVQHAGRRENHHGARVIRQ